MKRLTRRLSAAALMVFSSVCLAQTDEYRPPFQPGQHKAPPVGTPNLVLVLGTPHLSEMPEAAQHHLLEPLLERLARWRPSAIAIEALSGWQCDALRRQPARHSATVEAYCADSTMAARAAGLDVPAANAAADAMLATWPLAPTFAQRRRLALLFLAAGEPASAVVQWLRLPVSERVSSDGLTPDLIEQLEALRVRRNENYLIGAALAARMGHERVWPVDDQSAARPVADEKAYGAALAKAWDNAFTQQRIQEAKRSASRLAEPDGLLVLYREYNAARQPLLVYRSDFGAALVEPSPQGFGRSYVSYWETRNLRMVSNIREVIGLTPGTRLLAIVGASHKGYYEAYLDLMHDVRVQDITPVLK